MDDDENGRVQGYILGFMPLSNGGGITSTGCAHNNGARVHLLGPNQEAEDLDGWEQHQGTSPLHIGTCQNVVNYGF